LWLSRHLKDILRFSHKIARFTPVSRVYRIITVSKATCRVFDFFGQKQPLSPFPLPAFLYRAILPPMPADIRDHAILRESSAKLEELIHACRRRAAIHGHSPNLAADVTRKAKALRTSLASLISSLDRDAEAERPHAGKRKQPLYYRLSFDRAMTEMVRFVGYGGRSEIEFWDYYRDLAGRYSQQRASEAYQELCDLDRSTEPVTVLLKPEVQKLCGPLLGPPPERAR
jgi:hypothetical protein